MECLFVVQLRGDGIHWLIFSFFGQVVGVTCRPTLLRSADQPHRAIIEIKIYIIFCRCRIGDLGKDRVLILLCRHRIASVTRTFSCYTGLSSCAPVRLHKNHSLTAPNPPCDYCFYLCLLDGALCCGTLRHKNSLAAAPPPPQSTAQHWAAFLQFEAEISVAANHSNAAPPHCPSSGAVGLSLL